MQIITKSTQLTDTESERTAEEALYWAVFRTGGVCVVDCKTVHCFLFSSSCVEGHYTHYIQHKGAKSVGGGGVKLQYLIVSK